jgi:N-acetyltransferase
MELTEQVLENDYVRLEPIEEVHREPLREATNADRDIWASIYPYSLAGEHFDPSWARLQGYRKTGEWIPFAVVASGQCVGLTCYIRPEPANRAVDIGSTYYRPEVRGSVGEPGGQAPFARPCLCVWRQPRRIRCRRNQRPLSRRHDETRSC